MRAQPRVEHRLGRLGDRDLALDVTFAPDEQAAGLLEAFTYLFDGGADQRSVGVAGSSVV